MAEKLTEHGSLAEGLGLAAHPLVSFQGGDLTVTEAAHGHKGMAAFLADDAERGRRSRPLPRDTAAHVGAYCAQMQRSISMDVGCPRPAGTWTHCGSPSRQV